MLVAGDRTHGQNVLVDRKSRLTHISFLANKTAATTKQVILQRLKAYPDATKQSITLEFNLQVQLELLVKWISCDSIVA